MSKLFKESLHPSYGMLSFDRGHSSHPRSLFGSSIKHREVIRLTLKEGKVDRGLNNDWYHGNKTLFEVEMSYSQFAQLISSMNMGEGTPVTILRKGSEIVPECPFVDKSEQHLEEFKDSLENVYGESLSLIETVKEKFATKKSLTKSDKQEILNALHKISMNISCNQDYQLSSFQEQMDKTVTEAKGEIEAFYQNKLLQIANQALVENPEQLLSQSPIIELPVDSK